MANTIDVLGDEQTAALLISRTITEFVDDVLTVLGYYTFNGCSALTNVSLPNVTSIGNGAFQGCSALTNIDLPNVTSIGSSAFYGCSALTTVILRANQVATLSNKNAFTNANNAIIYVPDDLVDSYKANSRWSTYASRIKGISELPAA